MLILYFSGTGNSKYIAQGFASRMKADCQSIEEDLDFDRLILKSGPLAVCYPVYASCVPRIMREFVDKHKKAIQGRPLIILCTQMMFSGDGARAFARLLPGCEKHVIYAEHFNMPNNICNFFLFPVRDQERIRKTKAADKKLDLVCRQIKKGVVKRRGFHPYSSLLGKMQNVGFPEMEEKYRGSFIADKSCIGCGICVSCCPMHNLELKKNGVLQKNNCTLCYRCVNLCPKQAATVMLHAKPKRQYKGIKKK